MNITDINLFKRLKKSPLQKEIDLLNSNLIPVHFTFKSETGDVAVEYPTGFNMNNCVPVNVGYKVNATRYDMLPNHFYTTPLNVSVRSDKIYVYNSNTGLFSKEGIIYLRRY